MKQRQLTSKIATTCLWLLVANFPLQFGLSITAGSQSSSVCPASCSFPGLAIKSVNSSVKLPVATRKVVKRNVSPSAPMGMESLALGGDTVFEDAQVFRGLGKFSRERIPERVVHAKGVAAFGTFRVTNADISHFTSARLFQPNQVTRIGVRFSTSAGELGAADTAFGEVRGFGIKFYTDDGNFDLLGINLPIFFINDPQLFPHLMRALKRDPDSDLRTTDAFWDFISLRPEALNTITMLFTNYGLPDGYRHMPGFAVSAFKLTSGNPDRSVWAKFSWLPEAGTRFLDLENATKIAGLDPDYSRRDLFNSIAAGRFPSWRLYFQLATTDDLSTLTFDPFDATKLWSFDRFPLREIGVLKLTKNTKNSFAENEQMALNPANLVSGIEPSPDRLHRGRFFAYRDTQFYRLGVNHDLLPVNQEGRRSRGRSNGGTNANERNGIGRCDANLGGFPNYFPNSLTETSIVSPRLYGIVPGGSFRFSAENIWASTPADTLAAQYGHARATFDSLTSTERAALFHNLAFSLSRVKRRDVTERLLKHLAGISNEYRTEIERRLRQY